jgi:DNA (cytosine-5)-methyltransferase 1
MKEITTGSDFSGVGAFDQALERLGIKQNKLFACDMDKYARQTYIYNFGEPAYYPENVYNREIPEQSLDIYMTSPPCQSFSLAGKRQGENSDKGVLFYNSHEFIQKNKPRFFIFENVKGLLSDDSGKTFQRWIDYLGGKSVNGNPVIFPHENSTPYHVYYQVMNAKHYGVPQNRERIFIIGIRDDSDNNFSFPKPMHLTKRLKDVLESEVDEKYFLSDKMIKGLTDTSHLLYKRINNALRCGGGSSLTKKHSFDVVKIGHINQDTQASQVFSEYGTSPNICAGTHGYANGYVKIHSNTSKGYDIAEEEEDSINFSVPNSETRRGRIGKKVSQTLDTQCNQGIYTQQRIRRLTPTECFRLMDFNENFYTTINFNNIINSQGILLSLQNKKDIKWNVKELDATEKQKLKECVCSIIKGGTNTVMKILNLNTHTEVIQNAQLKIAAELFTAKDIVQNTTILTENGATLYLAKNNNQKSLKKQGNELLILEEKLDLEEKESLYTDYYLRLSLDENLKEVSAYTILTTIQTITNCLTYIYSIPKENTISVILNYKNSQNNFSKGELLNLKMGNTILSDSQLYKQAGNSIVVSCLVEIIKKLNI